MSAESIGLHGRKEHGFYRTFAAGRKAPSQFQERSQCPHGTIPWFHEGKRFVFRFPKKLDSAHSIGSRGRPVLQMPVPQRPNLVIAADLCEHADVEARVGFVASKCSRSGFPCSEDRGASR